MIKYTDATVISIIEDIDKNVFRYIFEFSPLPMCAISTKGRFLKVNQSLCNLLEYTQIEICDKTFTEITHPEDIGIEWANFKKLERKEGDTFTLTKRYITKTQKIIYVSITVFAVRDTASNIIYYAKHVTPLKDGYQAKIAEIEERLKDKEKKTIKEKIVLLLINHWQKIGAALLALAAFVYAVVDLRYKLDENTKQSLAAEEAIIEHNELLNKLLQKK
jgi:PAS domain S-box-containing protein